MDRVLTFYKVIHVCQPNMKVMVTPGEICCVNSKLNRLSWGIGHTGTVIADNGSWG